MEITLGTVWNCGISIPVLFNTLQVLACCLINVDNYGLLLSTSIDNALEYITAAKVDRNCWYLGNVRYIASDNW